MHEEPPVSLHGWEESRELGFKQLDRRQAETELGNLKRFDFQEAAVVKDETISMAMNGVSEGIGSTGWRSQKTVFVAIRLQSN